jgi:hypothetical protein
MAPQKLWWQRRRSERELPKTGTIQVPPTIENRVAVGMEDCDRCLVKDDLAALVSKRAQTNEGLKKMA